MGVIPRCLYSNDENRQEKYDVLQDVARQLEHNITPFHTTKERATIERKAEVVEQTSIF